MTAVQKLREAVNRNKREAEKKQQEERNDILAKQRTERQKKEEEERQKEQEEVLRQKRSTTDLDHRKERIEALKKELEKKKEQMIKDALNSLEDAEAAAAAAAESGTFSKMHIEKVDRTRRHAKSFVKDAQDIYEELVSSDGSAAQTHTVQIERLAAVAKQVEDAEAFLVERTKEARALTDALLKKDLRKMSKEDTFADEVKNVREEAESLLQDFDELSAVDDIAKVKSRELTGAEEKLRLGWTRLKPKLDDAIYNQLTVGDKSLDVVQAALASGKPGALSTAMQEIAKAEAAYKVPV
jgi:DNA repair exonuclease SbcCD ATPase subunit